MGEVLQLEGSVTPSPVKAKKSRGMIKRRKGSPYLYVRFSYVGQRIEKSTGLVDTPENESVARAWLDRQFDKIDDGSFHFADAFPGAPDKEKRFFSALEGREYQLRARDVNFGDYVKRWVKTVLAREQSPGKIHDYDKIIRCHLIPWFSTYSFEEINGVLIVEFVRDLQERPGKYRNGLSPNRIKNILIPLRAIWTDACEEYSWDLRDPFEHFKRKNRGGKIVPNRRKNPPEVFRFEEWEKILDAMDPYYKPIVELEVMTGMIASELAGLRRQDIGSRTIHVQNSIVRGVEKSSLKTASRVREIPITVEIQKRLDVLLARETGDHLVRMKGSAGPFNAASFWEGAWSRAIKAAGVPYRRPYVNRHTFALWSLMLGMPTPKLVQRMGHSSKQMVFEVYARYVEGIEDDIAKIRGYLGVDFA